MCERFFLHPFSSSPLFSFPLFLPFLLFRPLLLVMRLPPFPQLAFVTVLGVATAWYSFTPILKKWEQTQLELAEQRDLERASKVVEQQQQQGDSTNTTANRNRN